MQWSELRQCVGALSQQDAELAERSYLLTGSDEFLQPFEDSAQSLEARLKELDRGLVDPESRTLLAEINRAAREHMTFLREMTEQRRTQGPAVATDLVRQQIAKRQMDQLRDRIAALRSREKAMLIGRGVRADDVVAIGRGKRELLVPTADGVAEPRNRRVEIVVR